MLKYILAFQSKVLIFLMGLLGLTTCSNEEAVVMYGTPTATYKVTGTVINEEDQPIQNIRAVITDVPVDKEWQTAKDTAYTNSSGEFHLSKDGFPLNEVNLAIELTDIDGKENGEYKTKNNTIIFKFSELSGGDSSWNKGTATRDLGKIKLNKK